MNELNTLILESYSDLVDSRLELLLEGKEKPVQDLTDASSSAVSAAETRTMRWRWPVPSR